LGVRVNPVTKKEAFHYGIDIAAAKGTNILAVYEGTVKRLAALSPTAITSSSATP
jgi:murein DD-endopeptidase MepM/ murein hydrolase activator NlpD